jgi:hypothetical protein
MQQPAPSFRQQRRANRRIIWGILLILLGAIFLLQRMGVISTGFNWWAIFILVPAFGALSTAWFAWEHKGRFNHAVSGSLGGGLVILAVAFIFLFDLRWSIWWPLMLITPALAIIFSGISNRSIIHHPGARAATDMNFWVGGSLMLLGLTFLMFSFGVLPKDVFGNFSWWGVFILIPGLGALWNAYVLYHSENKMGYAARGLLTGGVIVTLVSVVAMAGLSWNLLAPILIIVVGLSFLLNFWGWPYRKE